MSLSSYNHFEILKVQPLRMSALNINREKKTEKKKEIKKYDAVFVKLLTIA